MVEIFVTALIVTVSAVLFYRSIKGKSKGSCNCGSCSSHCPIYEQKKN